MTCFQLSVGWPATFTAFPDIPQSLQIRAGVVGPTAIHTTKLLIPHSFTIIVSFEASATIALTSRKDPSIHGIGEWRGHRTSGKDEIRISDESRTPGV
jgi:hypothetical protein